MNKKSEKFLEWEKESQNIIQQIMDSNKILSSVGYDKNDFPMFMRPFLSLKMIESQIIFDRNLQKKEDNLTNEEVWEDWDEDLLHNEKIIKNNVTLKTVCSNNKTVFEDKLIEYLNSFDVKNEVGDQIIKKVLGWKVNSESRKYLSLEDILGKLNSKKIKYDYCKKWSMIDFNFKTEEEKSFKIKFIDREVKRICSELLASSAGKSHTPQDISDLVSGIVCNYQSKIKKEYFSIYDMACGGGNMLFNLEDKLFQENEGVYIKTFGQEINDELFALAKIGGLLRGNSYVSLANSLYEEHLVNGKGESIKMDYIVCNPPHGDSWSAESSEGSGSVSRKIESAKFYNSFPSKSDSQLLFLQHAIYKLKEDGLAVVVSNGSPLFSGDSGSGESETRKYILDSDYLEALIQLPEGEFFKTNITTYLWVINKNKSEERKNKILLINASNMYEKLKKNKGDKRNYIDENNRAKILKLLEDFQDSEFSKVFDRSYFYHNKQKLKLTHVDVDGKSFSFEKNGKKTKSFKFDNVKEVKDLQNNFIFNLEKIMDDYQEGENLLKEWVKPINNQLNKISKSSLCVTLNNGDEYIYDEKEDTIGFSSIEKDGNYQKLGNGTIKVKANYKKATKKQGERLLLEMEITPKTETDYEIIPYSFGDSENEENIKKFLNKWVDRPYEKMENVVGVEFNFNKIFYVPEELREIDSIERDLVKSYKNFGSLMEELIDMSKHE